MEQGLAGEAVHSGEEAGDRTAIRIVAFFQGGFYSNARLHSYLHPYPGIATVMKKIIHKPDMPFYGYPPARRTQVGFCGDGILPVTQVVGGIGKQLYQGDPFIRSMTFLPAGGKKSHSVEHQLAKAEIVLCQVVNGGSRDRIVPAIAGRQAVEISGA